MGASPSHQLYSAAVSGDIGAAEAALARGAELDFRNPDHKLQTPLFAAAKRNRALFVRWLLARGALSFPNTVGDTALHAAAEHGHCESVAVLLARGADHFARNREGRQPRDAAARAGHAAVVRVIEARTCPFFADLELEVPGLLSFIAGPSLERRWAAVHRARPLDNPNVDPREAALLIYLARSAAAPDLELLQPAVAPVRNDADGLVIVELTCERMLRRGEPVFPPRKLTARLPRPAYTWLRRVLSPGFSARPARAGDVFSADLVPLVPQTAYTYVHRMLGSFDWTLCAGGALGHLAVERDPQQALPPQAPLAAAHSHAQPPPPLLLQQMQMQQQMQHFQMQHMQAPHLHPQQLPLGLPVHQQHHHQQQQHQQQQQQQVVLVQRQPLFAPGPVQHAAHAAAPAAALPSPPTAPTNQLAVTLQREIDSGALTFDAPVPDALLCIITTELMLDPVIAADGFTYSRAGITEWLSRGKATSPNTNEPLASLALLPNLHVRAEVFDWVDTHRVRSAAAEPVTATLAAAAPAAPASVLPTAVMAVAAAQQPAFATSASAAAAAGAVAPVATVAAAGATAATADARAAAAAEAAVSAAAAPAVSAESAVSAASPPGVIVAASSAASAAHERPQSVEFAPVARPLARGRAAVVGFEPVVGEAHARAHAQAHAHAPHAHSRAAGAREQPHAAAADLGLESPAAAAEETKEDVPIFPVAPSASVDFGLAAASRAEPASAAARVALPG